MNCVLFAKMDQVFSFKKKKHQKNTGQNGQNTGKVRENYTKNWKTWGISDK